MTTRTLDQLKLQARSGDGQACMTLYEEYKNGVHVEPDPSQANDWLELALDCNESSAQFIIGMDRFKSGRVDTGLEYLQLAAANQNGKASYVLGQYYLGNIENLACGQVEVDKGIDYMQQAASLGNAQAQVVLGKCYYLGQWVQRNLFLSKVWLEKAMAAGNEEAGRIYDEVIRIPDLIH